ncbi:pyruvate, water dikinase regulatory protein [Loigolactobacillus iwatensis]|uniref:pyruvate, water dikinase regulatory protein n=1 Tax=Loigolactobacillus iwatensis TaxID=1267156 RepID=UPI000F7F63F1|nr:pyruvate, water dikinase regulatory protein [Loigolactobacillus iwatensis]
MTKQQVKIYVISDSVGETAQRAIQATLLQYPAVEATIKIFPFVTEIDELEPIMREAATEKALIAITLVDPKLVQWVTDFTTTHQMTLVDYMTPLMTKLAGLTQEQPIRKPGIRHAINQDYLKKVAAVDFAVAHDDGQQLQSFLKADLILLGVSRTAKTPVSLYLANQRLKVANLPLIPGTPLPEDLLSWPKEKLVGLTIDPKRLQSVRQTRMAGMGLAKANQYTDLEQIKSELQYADRLFAQLKIEPIDTTVRSVEETAAVILAARKASSD